MKNINLTAPLQITAAAGKPRRFAILAYSGGTLNVEGFPVPVVVDLAGLEVPASVPILIDHTKSVEATLGVTDSVSNDGKTLSLAGVVTGQSALAQSVLAQSAAGQTWQASIGAQTIETEEVPEGRTAEANGRTFTGPVIIARRSVLRETSVLPMGADYTTSVNLAAAAAGIVKGMAMSFEDWVKSLGLDAATLSPENQAALQLAWEATQTPAPMPAAAPVAPVAPVAAAPMTPPVMPEEEEKTAMAKGSKVDIQAQLASLRKQTADELRRHSEIQIKAAGYPVIAAKAIEDGWSLDKVELEVIKARQVSDKTRPTSFTSAQNAPENLPNVLEAAVCMTRKIKDVDKQYDDKTMQAAHGQFRRGIGLQELMLMAAASNGMPVSPGTRITPGNLREVLQYSCQQQTIQAAFSAVSLPGILSNVANKEILEGYMEEDAVWREVANVKSVSDFKTVTSYRMLDNMEYEQLGPGGQIKHGTLGEESYTRQADTYAKMFSLTRTMIINDDMGALDDLRNRIGRGGAIKLNDLFWTTFLSNPTTFWTTARTNYIEGSTTNLGTDGVGLGLGVTAFRKRTSPAADGAKRLSGSPKKLLVPPELEFIAQQLYKASNLTAVKVSDANIHANKYEPIVANQLSDSSFGGGYSTTAWYLLGDKGMGSPVVVSFLNGQETPTVENADADFNTLGIQFRGYHDFGCDQAEYLAGIKSKGAA